MTEELEKMAELLPKTDISVMALLDIKESLSTMKMLMLQLVMKDNKSEQKSEQKSDQEIEVPELPEAEHDVSLKDALEYLKDVAINRVSDGNETEYLLHLPTQDFEYEKCKDEAHFNAEEREWVPEVMISELNRDNKNPVVSCWVPESSIKEIPTPLAPNGTWGDLGKNPHRFRYKIIVKPGKYEIYQELRA